MTLRTLCLRFVLPSLLLLALPAVAQGTLEDYQRAERFLSGNLRHHAFPADVTPHWVEKTNRFWYRRATAKGGDFILVDSEQNTVGPAFDQSRLAAALTQALKQNYSPTDLPFQDFDFVDNGKAIRFSLDGGQWTCQLATYECKAEDASPRNPTK